MTSDAPDRPETASTGTGLGRAVGRGMSWSLLSSIWVKAGSFAAQLALGYYLSEGDWGVYAIAIAISAPFTAMKEGRTNELILARGPERYDDTKGPIFWISLAINATLAAILALAAPAVASFYGQSEVAPMLWLVAAALVLGTPAGILRAKLQVDLRFGAFSQLTMLSTVVRYGGAVGLAIYGVGPMSFVLPLPFVAALELLVLMVLTSDSPWKSAPVLARWRGLLRDVKWLILGALALVLMTMGDYMVLGRLVPTETLGVYYFAFQLVTQSTMIATASVGTVLLAALARFATQPERQRRATLRSLAALTLVTCPLALGLGVVIDPLEQLVWHGRWQSAVVPVQILCLVMPVRLSFMVASTSLKARGLFRTWSLLTVVTGLGLVGVAAVAGAVDSDAAHITLYVAAYFGVATPLCFWLSVRELDIGLRDLLVTFAPAWLIAVVAAGACVGADRIMVGQMTPPVRVAAAGLGFVLLYTLGCRLLIPGRVADALSVLPQAIAGVGGRLLRLAPKSAV